MSSYFKSEFKKLFENFNYSYTNDADEYDEDYAGSMRSNKAPKVETSTHSQKNSQNVAQTDFFE